MSLQLSYSQWEISRISVYRMFSKCKRYSFVASFFSPLLSQMWQLNSSLGVMDSNQSLTRWGRGGNHAGRVYSSSKSRFTTIPRSLVTMRLASNFGLLTLKLHLHEKNQLIFCLSHCSLEFSTTCGLIIELQQDIVRDIKKGLVTFSWDDQEGFLREGGGKQVEVIEQGACHLILHFQCSDMRSLVLYLQIILALPRKAYQKEGLRALV